MNEMTEFEYRNQLKLIIAMAKRCKDKEEILEELQKLLEEETVEKK